MTPYIGLFSAEDTQPWNDNPNNTAGPEVVVTSHPKPKTDNTMLYIGIAAIALLLIYKK